MRGPATAAPRSSLVLRTTDGGEQNAIGVDRHESMVVVILGCRF